jgi:nitrate reductase gamma subunit
MVLIRVLLEIFCFRSLFRNTRFKFTKNLRITYNLEIFLWLSALAFHYSFFVVLFRHLRFFTEPTLFLVKLLERVDSFFRIEISYDFIQFALPGVFLSGIVLLISVFYLFLRRVLNSQVRYISLFSDFFPLFLIMGIAFTGILMRYFSKVDIISVKELIISLVTFRPIIPENIGGIFYSHLFFVCILLAYFPFSKLMHSMGIIFSPTRNMTGNTREVRHINPWNYPVKVHTYQEYEDHFREKMINAGVPIESDLEKQSSGKE